MAATPPIKLWLRIASIVAIGIAAFIVGGIIHGSGSLPGDGFTWIGVLKLLALLASLGALYGVVLALDVRSEMAVADMPRLRTALCAVAGAAAVLVVWFWFPGKFSLTWLAAGAAAGAALGWYGWRWARHVDF